MYKQHRDSNDFGEILLKFLKLIKLEIPSSEAEILKEIFLFYPYNVKSLNELKSLMTEKGISECIKKKTELLFLLLHSWKRIEDKNTSFSTPQEVYYRFRFISRLPKETMRGIYMNVRNEPVLVKVITVGGYNTLYVSPSDVLYHAVKKNARRFILIHNHPSGDTAPSEEDLSFTRKMDKCAKILGLTFLDHIIIGKGKWFSFKKEHII